MNLAILAHDEKKELMEDLCIAYKYILAKHTVYSSGTSGSIIKQATGIDVKMMDHGELGRHQIAARAAYNEIDMVIFLQGDQENHQDGNNALSLFKLCDQNNIPYATNLATAEMLIMGLDRGDLDWRELL